MGALRTTSCLLRLRNVPAEVLRGCLSLARLSLHGNPLTLEQLRSSDGFQDFNARRCASADKQVRRLPDQAADKTPNAAKATHRLCTKKYSAHMTCLPSELH